MHSIYTREVCTFKGVIKFYEAKVDVHKGA